MGKQFSDGVGSIVGKEEYRCTFPPLSHTGLFGRLMVFKQFQNNFGNNNLNSLAHNADFYRPCIVTSQA